MHFAFKYIYTYIYTHTYVHMYFKPRALQKYLCFSTLSKRMRKKFFLDMDVHSSLIDNRQKLEKFNVH